jgi:hypothetical protein
MRWLGGIYIPQPFRSCWQRLLAMSAPDIPVAHQIVIVHCPVHATSAQPLGFGAVDVGGVRRLAAPDSLVTSDFCAALFNTIAICRRPLAFRESLLRWLTEQFGGTLDSSVNYIRGCPGILESGAEQCLVHTGHCPVRQKSAHSMSCSNF